MIKLTSHDPQETEQIGYKLGTMLQGGDVVCLTGDLGAGKTTLTQAIARGLGVKEDVTSPTFGLIHEYSGRVPLYHFDVYRIHNIEELEDLGYEEYFYGQGVCIIEWASQIREVIPKEHLWIHIQRTEGDHREIGIEGTTARFHGIVEELNHLC